MSKEPLTNGDKRDNKGRFVEGHSGGPGRPVGSVSIIAKLKNLYEEDPEKFEAFVKRYEANPSNEKHIAEMIDGKPHQSIQTEVTMPDTLIDLIKGN